MALGLSVAIPTHNRRETVVLAVGSALAQTRAPAEVLVVCDGCTDGTQEAVAALDPRVVVLDLPKGPGYSYENRNRALEAARGEAVAWLADDDLWLPDHLERVGALLDRGAEVVQAMTVVLDPHDALYGLAYDWSIPSVRDLLARTAAYTPSSAVAHRVEVALAIGGWDGRLERAGDLDLWRRLIASGARSAMAGAPTVLCFQATDRDQAWPDRVAQNARWLARIEDERELPLVRAELDRAFRQIDAWRVEGLAERDAAVARAADVERLHADVAALHAELARVQAVLDSVLASRWWRLRQRLRRRR